MRNYSFALIMIAMFITSPGDAARKRISEIIVPGVYSEADIEKEILFGREMAAVILADNKLSTNVDLNRYLNLVGQSLLRNAGRSELYFHFSAIESDQINAYAAPGGYIFVTIPALNLMQSEAELAGVLAHEIAHITDRHIVEALRIRADDESTTAILGKMIGSGTGSASVIFQQAVDQALDLLFSKGLAIEDEVEADKQGIILSALAGYDPAAYYQYLERIKPIIENKNAQLGHTHPPVSERIDRLKQVIENEGLTSQGQYINRARFQQYQ